MDSKMFRRSRKIITLERKVKTLEMYDSRTSTQLLTDPEILRTISVLDAIHRIGEAWELLEPATIQNYFPKVGLRHTVSD